MVERLAVNQDVLGSNPSWADYDGEAVGCLEGFICLSTCVRFAPPPPKFRVLDVVRSIVNGQLAPETNTHD